MHCEPYVQRGRVVQHEHIVYLTLGAGCDVDRDRKLFISSYRISLDAYD